MDWARWTRTEICPGRHCAEHAAPPEALTPDEVRALAQWARERQARGEPVTVEAVERETARLVAARGA